MVVTALDHRTSLVVIDLHSAVLALPTRAARALLWR
jgi:hypothetical protein